MNRKNHCLIKACYLLSLLTVCLGLSAAAGEAAVPPADMMRAYEDVLLGGRSYIQCNLMDGIVVEGAAMPAEIGAWYGYLFDTPLQFEAFCVTDLDTDGNPDMLLKLPQDFGYELLRWENGQVYGFPFVARAMEALTADGEIHGSSGADNFGWYKVRFGGAVMETAEVCWKRDDPGIDFVYSIG
ncbi:MAG: hypothetical protein ABIK64_03330, partial [Bacillota bacterium]